MHDFGSGWIDSFILNKEYLGTEIYRRTKLGLMAFCKLIYILKNKNIPLHLKKRVCDQCVLTVNIYGSQTWTLTKSLVKKLAKTEWCMERSILHISFKDRKSNNWIKERTQVADIVKKITTLKWHFTDNDARPAGTASFNNGASTTAKETKARLDNLLVYKLKRCAGLDWIRINLNRIKWREFIEAYIQKWISMV